MACRTLFLLAISAAAAVLGLAAAGASSASDPLPLRLFYGATFHTGSANAQGRTAEDSSLEARTAEAVLVRDGRVVALGDFREISGSTEAAGAERIDLGGAHVFAGFQDAHVYLDRYGATLEDVDLSGTESFDSAIERVAEFASSLPAGEWVVGSGWDESLWEPAADSPESKAPWPSHGRLSEAVPGHPVLVTRVDGQVGLANRLALARAGFDPEAEGENGIVQGERLAKVRGAAPEPSPATLARRIHRAQDRLLGLGLTAVHAMDVSGKSLEVLAKLRDRGELRIRVLAYLDSLRTAEELGEARVDGLGDRYEMLTLAGVAWELDGGFGSRGAALLAPYADEDDQTGRLAYGSQALASEIERGARLGLQPSIRATGDRAVRTALQAIRQAGERASGFESLRPRIEFAQLVAEQDLALLGRLRVIPVMMPQHLASDLRWVTARLGKERAARAYAWKSVDARASLPVAFGSALPIGAPDPLLGIHSAITRQTLAGEPRDGFQAQERMAARAALAAWTSAPAAAGRQEDGRGRIALGYAADFTALSVNVLDWDAGNASEGLKRARVVATIVNGDVVYRAGRGR